MLADAEGLLTCYGVGEESGAALTHAVIELCFTSSVRFLQPGLLLQVSAVHSPCYLPKLSALSAGYSLVFHLIHGQIQGEGGKGITVVEGPGRSRDRTFTACNYCVVQVHA